MREAGSSFVIRHFGPLVGLLLVAGFMSLEAQKTVAYSGRTAVGQVSAPLPVPVTLLGSGVAAALQMTPSMASGAEFAVLSGGSCVQGAAYSVGQVCTVMVTFQPLAPGIRVGAVVLLDSSGNVMGETNLSGVGAGPLAVLDPGDINTVAGSGEWIYRGDGVLATKAPIFLPMGVVVDAAGNLYLSDSSNSRVRRVDAASGVITTVAGNGIAGYSGDGGPALLAMVSQPAGLALDGAGNLYFADTGNQVIRRVDAFTGVITTVAGMAGVEGYEGDGGAATKANLSFPEAIAIDANGSLYISDTGNNVIRRVDASGTISTFAGTGVPGFNGDGIQASGSQLNNPWGLAVGSDGSLYVADMDNNSIRKINAGGVMSTVAGSRSVGFSGDNAAATAATLKAPAAVAIDPAGNLYVADSGNNRVRKVYASTGVIDTICGSSSVGMSGDAGPANKASLYGPYALYLDGAGDLFVADLFDNRVREISAIQLSLSYPVMRVGKVSDPLPVMLANDGNTSLQLTQMPLVMAALDVATSTCALGSALSPGVDCTVGAEFAPTAVGLLIGGTITLDSNAPVASGIAPVIELSGEVLSVNPTAVVLASSTNPSMVASSVTFTASLSGGSGLTGTVAFLDGATQLCNVAVVSQAAACVASSLTLGSHRITAQYSGDTEDAASDSAVLTQVVKQQPTLTLSVSPNPANVGATVTMTLQTSAPSGTATGSILFYDGTTVLGNAALVNGVATISTTSLGVGTHTVYITYSGDTANVGGGSNVIGEVIQATATTTLLSSGNANVVVGTPVTLTAMVSNGGTPVPTGSVHFMDGAVNLGVGVLNASGVATLTTAALSPGVHSVVAVYGGDSVDAGSQSAALTETVQQVATTTTLASSANPVSAGATLQLTASVSAAAGGAGGAITGSVTFSDGAIPLGVVAVDANGNAVLGLVAPSVGAHTIVATYSGSTNYSLSASSALHETVQQTATATTLHSAVNPALAGKTISMSIAVSSSTGVPTGTLILMDSGVNIGSAALNAKGVASFSLSTLGVGVHTLTAVYGGDSSYTSSSSAALQETVVLATTGLTIAGTSAPVNAGVATSVSGSLSSNGVTPTGTVTLLDGSVPVGAQSMTGGGAVSFAGVMLAVGTHSLTLAYAGDADNAKVISAIVVIVVQPGASTETLTTSVSPQIQGLAVTFTATVNSASPAVAGSVNFMDGATLVASVPVNAAGVATYSTSVLAVGTHLMSAVYAGDTNHAASNTASLTELIVQASTALLMSSVNPSVSGNNVVFTAKISGNGATIPTGSVTFTDGAGLLGTVALDASGAATLPTAALAVGSHAITVSYAGDGSYFASTARLSQTVQSASTQLTLTASANPATYGQAVTFSASVTSNGGAATGGITFMVDGTSFGTALLSANGVATLSTSSLTPGSHTVLATYAGDGKAAACSSVPLKMSVLETTAVALASSADPTTTLSGVVLTVVVTNSGVGVPTGSITFSDGATRLGAVALDAHGGATLSMAQMSVGAHTLVATYAGDASNFAAVSPNLTETVTLRPTTTTVSGSPNSTTDAQSVLLIGVTHASGPIAPGGTITFAEGTQVLGAVAVDAGGVATLSIILQPGANNVVATYSGDGDYSGSASQQTAILGGTATQFSMVLSPAAMTMVSKQHGASTLVLTSVSGYTDIMEFGCLGLPFAATCTFSAPKSVLPANGSVSVQVTVDTGDPLGAGSAAKNTMVPSNVILCLLPAGLLLSFCLRRKRKMMGLLLAVYAVAITMSATGCAGLQVNGTPAGVYSFKVTASGQGTGVTESQVMTLTVTQ